MDVYLASLHVYYGKLMNTDLIPPYKIWTKWQVKLFDTRMIQSNRPNM